MSLHHHLVGSSVILIGSCALVHPLTEVQTPTEPTTVTFYRLTPDGVLTTYIKGVSPEVVNLAPGIDACTVTVLQAGREKWRYASGGLCESAAEHEFSVDASAVL